MIRQVFEPIETAPRTGKRIWGRDVAGNERLTYWGKKSHIPFPGWICGDDPEDQNLWDPVEWAPLFVSYPRGLGPS